MRSSVWADGVQRGSAVAGRHDSAAIQLGTQVFRGWCGTNLAARYVS